MSEAVRLGDHLTIAKGKPPLLIPFNGNGAEVYLSPEYLRGNSSPTLAKPSRDSVRVNDGDTVLLWDGSNAGEFFSAKTGIIASTMAKLQSSDAFIAGYFYHVLKHTESTLKGKTNGTGIPHVDREILEAWMVFCPAKEQQAFITELLDTVDTAIKQTEAIIEKLKQVKQGLLHDLLTRGIDSNGNLRPAYEDAPELYKESVLGCVPREWEVTSISDLLSDTDPAMRSGPFGSALLKGELVESGYPLLGIDNVFVERFVDDYKRFVTPAKFAELSRYAVRPSDLMITIMGTVGRCCLVPEDIGIALSSKHTWTISLDKARYSPYLAMLQINYSPWVLNCFARDQQGGTMAAIRSETLRTLLLPAPPRQEQAEMEVRLLEISCRIEAEILATEKMKAEKSGLMDDLLTGRVRVTGLAEKGAAHVN